MSLPIYVDAYSGYKANERPRQFSVDEDLIEIAEVEDRWYEPDAGYDFAGRLASDINEIKPIRVNS